MEQVGMWQGGERLGSQEPGQRGRRQVTQRAPVRSPPSALVREDSASGRPSPGLHPLGFVRSERRRCVVRMTDEPHRQRAGPVPAREALGPSKKFWRVRPQGERDDHETARIVASRPRLDAVERRWLWVRLCLPVPVAIAVAQVPRRGSWQVVAPTPRTAQRGVWVTLTEWAHLCSPGCRYLGAPPGPKCRPYEDPLKERSSHQSRRRFSVRTQTFFESRTFRRWIARLRDSAASAPPQEERGDRRCRLDDAFQFQARIEQAIEVRGQLAVRRPDPDPSTVGIVVRRGPPNLGVVAAVGRPTAQTLVVARKAGCTMDATNHPPGRSTVATVASVPERPSMSIRAISQVQPSKGCPSHQLGARVTSAWT